MRDVQLQEERSTAIECISHSLCLRKPFVRQEWQCVSSAPDMILHNFCNLL